MFCHQCGIEIPDRSSFCSSCGVGQQWNHNAKPGTAPQRPGPSPWSSPKQPTPTNGGPEAASSPVLELKPVFVGPLQVLGHIPIFLFLGVWGGGFFGGFSMVFLQFIDSALPQWIPFVFFGVLFACLLPLISYKINRKTYAQTLYTFFPDKLDYFEGFFSVKEKTIPLSRVTEVHLRKGYFQAKYGLGTVLLSTPASSISSGRAGAGIRIVDVENPDEVYAQVKELVEGARRNTRQAA